MKATIEKILFSQNSTTKALLKDKENISNDFMGLCFYVTFVGCMEGLE